MASFTFSDPSGKKYSVEGPDGSTPEQAFQILQTQIGAPAPPSSKNAADKQKSAASLDQLETALRNADAAGDTDAARALAAEYMRVKSQAHGTASANGSGDSVALDVAKSGGVGLGRGVIGLGGLVGDMNEVAKSIGDWAASKVMSPEKYQKGREMLSGQSNLLPTSADIRAKVEDQTGEFYKPKTTAGEYAQTVGEFTPGLVFSGPGNLARSAATNVLLPALGSETAGQLTKGTSAEPWARAAGALAGGVLPSMAGRAVTPLPVNAERRAMVDTLRNEGVNVTAGQASGRPALRYAESALGDSLGAGGKATRAFENQKEQFTGALLRKIGESGTRATPEVIDSAFTRIGQQFDDLAARNTLNADRQLLGDVRNAVSDYHNVVSAPMQAPAIKNYVTEISNALTKNGGTLPGDVYQSLRSRMEKTARQLSATTPGGIEARSTIRGIRSALDDAMERSIAAIGNTADLGAWRAARKDYAKLLDITRAAGGAGEDAAAGLVSPAAMRGALNRGDQAKRNYARGKGDLSELTRAGVGIMSPLPQSGTAPRLAAQALPMMIGAGAGGMLGGGAGASLGGMAGSMAGVATPALIGRLLMSGPAQRYLKNQVAAPMLSGLDSRRAAVVGALLEGKGQLSHQRQ